MASLCDSRATAGGAAWAGMGSVQVPAMNEGRRGSEDLPVETSLTSRPQFADNGERETSGPIEAASSHGHCCRENSN
jgi:hypothetical protein